MSKIFKHIFPETEEDRFLKAMNRYIKSENMLFFGLIFYHKIGLI